MSIKGQGHSLTLVKGHSDFKVIDFWPVYSGELFRASGPSCFDLSEGIMESCKMSGKTQEKVREF